MGRLTGYTLPIIVVIASLATGWIMRGKPTEEQPTGIPPFGLKCIEDISRWPYIQKPSGQLALSPTQLARVFCSMPAVHKGYKDNETNAEQHAQETIEAISSAEKITKDKHSTE